MQGDLGTCRRCGIEVPAEHPYCPGCGRRVGAPWWARLLRRLAGAPPGVPTQRGHDASFRVRPVRTAASRRPSRTKASRIMVKDKSTGETRVYGTVDELPPKVRALYERALAEGDGTIAVERSSTIHDLDDLPADIRRAVARGEIPVQHQWTITDPDGVTRTYDRIEDVPEAYRRLLE